MIGTGLFNPSVTAVALGSVPGEQSGLAAGVNDTFRQGGIAVGVAALGALVPAQDAFGGSADAYVGGLQDALWAGAALALAGALAALWLIRMPAREQPRRGHPGRPGAAEAAYAKRRPAARPAPPSDGAGRAGMRTDRTRERNAGLSARRCAGTAPRRRRR